MPIPWEHVGEALVGLGSVASLALGWRAHRRATAALGATGGSGVGPAQDASGQALLAAYGLATPQGGTGVGPLQDATMQVLIANIGALPGGGLYIRIPIALATVSSVAFIPNGAVVTRAYVDNSVAAGGAAYSVGTTIQLGIAGTPALFMAAGDSNPQVQALYDALQDTVCTAKAHLLVTVAGAPAAGSGFACVEFSTPLV